MGLKSLANAVKKSRGKTPKTTEEKILGEIDKFFMMSPEEKGEEPRADRLAFRPSSLHKCPREIYYFLTGEPVKENRPARSQRILDVGSALHEWIQNDVLMKMGELESFKITLLSDEDMPTYGIEGVEFIKEHDSSPMEIKFLDTRHSTKFPISGMVDGALEYEDERMLFEFKTINTNDFNFLIEPQKPHLVQGAVYVVCTGIKKVLFVYLDKNTQDLKGYLVEYTEEQIEWVKARIAQIEESVLKEVLPDKQPSRDCVWCKYKVMCKEADTEDDDS